ncbi:hypothetical protein ACWET9_44285, partial [Streptomyces sp. NPDC004059]
LAELRIELPSLLCHDSQLPLQSRSLRYEGRDKGGIGQGTQLGFPEGWFGVDDVVGDREGGARGEGSSGSKGVRGQAACERDAPQQGGHPGLSRLRDLREEIAGVVDLYGNKVSLSAM